MQSIVVTVGSPGGIPSDGTAEAAVVNVTGVAGSAATYLSVFPTSPTALVSQPELRQSTSPPERWRQTA
jgi:hypothetical protein